MTTDTAVRVTRMIVQENGMHSMFSRGPTMETEPLLATLEGISYVDHPEIKVDEHESTEMPFRYVTGKNGEPIMPPVSIAPDDVCIPCTEVHCVGHGRSDQEGL